MKFGRISATGSPPPCPAGPSHPSGPFIRKVWAACGWVHSPNGGGGSPGPQGPPACQSLRKGCICFKEGSSSLIAIKAEARHQGLCPQSCIHPEGTDCSQHTQRCPSAPDAWRPWAGGHPSLGGNSGREKGWGLRHRWERSSQNSILSVPELFPQFQRTCQDPSSSSQDTERSAAGSGPASPAAACRPAPGVLRSRGKCCVLGCAFPPRARPALLVPPSREGWVQGPEPSPRLQILKLRGQF